MKDISPLYWKNGKLYILNQKLLPHKIQYIVCTTHRQAANSIKEMIVRGAPAIGITAAFGMTLAINENKTTSLKSLIEHLKKAAETLKRARPTAVNLSWAVDRMINLLKSASLNKLQMDSEKIKLLKKLLEDEAVKILNEDIEMNKKISTHGAKLLKHYSKVMTHCNAGALATGGIGTALGIIVKAKQQNKIKNAYACETRPYLQGARLTTWELHQQGVPVTLITDNMAGYIMKTEKISAIIVGADRIAENGDTANKIGTYSLAILAKYHNIPFYVAAPSSSIDTKIKSGREIPIEERPSKEVTDIQGIKIAPEKVMARHPGFDVTPAKLIKSIITEKGVFKYPYLFKSVES